MKNTCLEYSRLGHFTALIVLALWSGACDDPTNTPQAASDLLELDADNVMYGMVAYLTRSGVREGRIEADTAYLYADSGKAYLRSMKVVFYDDAGHEKATVTALRGEWAQDTDRMIARGNVLLIVQSDGRRIQSAEIHYDPQTERIWSDSATVQTLADGSVTSGTAFQSDLDFANIKIENIRGGAAVIF